LPTGVQQQPPLHIIYRIGKEWSGISSEVKRKGKRREEEHRINLSSTIKEHRQLARKTVTVHFSENECTRFLWNISIHQPQYTASHPR
jgi:hypothetical protein